MKCYGLIHNDYPDSLLGWCSSGNSDGECCVSVEFELCCYSDPPWLVKDKEIAEKVANTNTPWYNAGYDSPKNAYVGKLTVVEIDMKVG